GEHIKTVARELEIAPNTLRKYLRGDNPPQRKPRPRAKLLDRYVTHVDELIRSTPKITAVRVGSYLRQNVDPELRVYESTLRKFVAARRSMLVPKEAFVRATYAPGDQAQFDFTPVKVSLAGVIITVQLFVIRLSYSGRFFARASIRCDRPSLFAGLLAGFSAFGGLTRCALFDNASTAVKKILRGRHRKENDEFAAFLGALTLEVTFAAPAKGNEKGGVEGINGYIEDNFFRPIPSFANLEELNAGLLAFCESDMVRINSAHQESIAARFAREATTLRALPPTLPRACITDYGRVNKFSEVTFEHNWYSVPARYAHRHAVIEVYEDRLRIIVGTEVVAEHRRGFGRNERFLDPRHYLDLLAHKHRAAETALVLSDGRIPAVLHELFARYRQTDEGSATKRWTAVLALLADVPAEQLAQTVTHALARGTDDPAAIALLLQQRCSTAKMASDLRQLPVLARIVIPTSDLSAYTTTRLAEAMV
ncbi:MAG TPA: IS21 family transposase, partial [Candidatus Rubrimentiphilum sp.]|nr:IS21 family transposase [Candidatus Rubrimentiphilum sp.]